MADRKEDKLRDLQQWMHTVITHPDGVPSGVDSDAARQLVDVSLNEIEQVIEPSQQLDSVSRLAVYGNAYYARLLECLRDEFPALVQAVGESAFDGLAFGYLQHHPPHSYTLSELGDEFPKYLRATRPDDGEPQPNWTDFLIELAELERLYAEVFDGPGPERTGLLRPETLEAIDGQQWPQAKLVVVPWLHLKQFQYPVHEYASAVRVREQQPPPPDAESTFLAITRRDYVVRRTPLNRAQFEMLAAMQNGAAVVKAIERGAAFYEGEADQLGDAIRRWFFDWTAAGFFRDVELPG